MLRFPSRRPTGFKGKNRGVRPSSTTYSREMDSFRIVGLAPAAFAAYFGKTDDELAAVGARRHVVDEHPGFPDRIEMRDLEIGETVILLNYEHMNKPSPYRSSHAIFIREGATEAYDRVDEIPEVMRSRLLSVRSFTADGMMLDADVLPGTELSAWIVKSFGDPDVDFIDVHNAKRGCFSGRISRA
jgi:hypothetical protein